LGFIGGKCQVTALDDTFHPLTANDFHSIGRTPRAQKQQPLDYGFRQIIGVEYWGRRSNLSLSMATEKSLQRKVA